MPFANQSKEVVQAEQALEAAGICATYDEVLLEGRVSVINERLNKC